MTLSQIITEKENRIFGRFGTEAKVWEKYGKTNIYFKGFDSYLSFDGKNVKAIESKSRQGYYETDQNYDARMFGESKVVTQIQILARYFNYLLNK